MSDTQYVVTQLFTCRFCGGKSKKCYVCRGEGLEGRAPENPTSVLTWLDPVTCCPEPDVTKLVIVQEAEDREPIITVATHRLGWTYWNGSRATGVIAYADLPSVPVEFIASDKGSYPREENAAE